MADERRDLQRRGEFLKRIIDCIVQNPDEAVTIRRVEELLAVPLDAAQRIVERLAACGVLYEARRGIWLHGGRRLSDQGHR
jgi:predicted transcriptional regulator of viral defense system